MATALQVRGVCPKCRHVVNTTAPPRRATWRGPCPVNGCEGRVIAKAVRDLTPSPKAGDDQADDDTSSSAPPARRRKAVRIDGYAQPQRRKPEGGDAADVPGTPEPKQRPEPAARPADDAEPERRAEPARREPEPEPQPEPPAAAPRQPEPEQRIRRATPWDHLY